MNNEENYKELRSVIDSLPNWITLNDNSAFDENDEFTDEESEFDDEDSEFDEDGYSSVSDRWPFSRVFLVHPFTSFTSFLACHNQTNRLSLHHQESKETNLSDEELPGKPLNSDHVVPASFTTPIKVFNLPNIFNNNIPSPIPPREGGELEN